MILNDKTIKHYCMVKKMITPYNPNQINPGSYDITIGNTLIIPIVPDVNLWDNNGFGIKYSKNELVTLKEKSEIDIIPNGFILLSSKETFNLPSNICGQFALKSTMARKGLCHMLAGWCDPGWHGSVLTMELVNLSKTTITLTVGQPIGQMIFMKMCAEAEKPYQGKYNNDTRVSAAKK